MDPDPHVDLHAVLAPEKVVDVTDLVVQVVVTINLNKISIVVEIILLLGSVYYLSH